VKKLILIAAMLMLPAIASAQMLADSDFESPSFTLGDIAGQSDYTGATWGASQTHPQVMVDPNDAGNQVLGFAAPLGQRSYCYVGNALGDTMFANGTTVASIDYYLMTEGEEFRAEIGPNTDYYLDTVQTPGLTLNAWTGGNQWDPWAGNLTVVELAPLQANTWFNVTQVLHDSTDLVDIYLDGVLVGWDLPTFYGGSNSISLDYFAVSLDGDVGLLVDNVTWEHIPEPSIMLLGGVGLLALLRRRKK